MFQFNPYDQITCMVSSYWTVRVYSYGPTVRVWSDRTSIRIRSGPYAYGPNTHMVWNIYTKKLLGVKIRCVNCMRTCTGVLNSIIVQSFSVFFIYISTSSFSIPYLFLYVSVVIIYFPLFGTFNPLFTIHRPHPDPLF